MRIFWDWVDALLVPTTRRRSNAVAIVIALAGIAVFMAWYWQA